MSPTELLSEQRLGQSANDTPVPLKVKASLGCRDDRRRDSLVMRHVGMAAGTDAYVDRRVPGVQRVQAGELNVLTHELLTAERAGVAEARRKAG